MTTVPRRRSLLLLAMLLWPSGACWCASPLADAGPSPRLRRLVAEAAQDSARLRALTQPATRLGGFSAGRGAAGEGDNLCEAAIRPVEMAQGLPPGLLGAIARVESGRRDAKGQIAPWPWTVDADGQSRYFADRETAVAWTRLALAQGAKAVDVGCMQVDLQQHPQAFRTLEDAFLPASNVQYAAQFMRQLWAGAAHEDWTLATGYYHSRTAALSADYLLRVRNVLTVPIPALATEALASQD